MKKLVWVISTLTAIILVFGLVKIALPLLKGNNALLNVDTRGFQSKVYLDDKLLGTTPYIGKNLLAGNHKLRLAAQLTKPTSTLVEFSTPVTLTAQTLTAVNYEFGPNQKFSSGDIRTLLEGEGLSVITTPAGADIWLDGENVGKGPFSANPAKGIHKLKIIKEGFVTRELEINFESDYRLVVEVFLAENPFEKVTQVEESSFQVYTLATSQKSLLDDTSAWAAGAFFFEKNAGLNFDCFIDGVGKTYFEDKKSFDEKVKSGKTVVVGYLISSGDKEIAASAKTALDNLKGSYVQKTQAPTAPQVEILSTPTGILNVRSGAGTGYPIITKVNPGEKYELLGESPGWYQIKTPAGNGWVSSQYAKKL